MLVNNFVVRLADIQPLEAVELPEGAAIPDIREEVALKGSFNLFFNDRTNAFTPFLKLDFSEETIEFFKQIMNREEITITASVDAESGRITVSAS